MGGRHRGVPSDSRKLRPLRWEVLEGGRMIEVTSRQLLGRAIRGSSELRMTDLDSVRAVWQIYSRPRRSKRVSDGSSVR